MSSAWVRVLLKHIGMKILLPLKKASRFPRVDMVPSGASQMRTSVTVVSVCLYEVPLAEDRPIEMSAAPLPVKLP